MNCFFKENTFKCTIKCKGVCAIVRNRIRIKSAFPGAEPRLNIFPIIKEIVFPAPLGTECPLSLLTRPETRFIFVFFQIQSVLQMWEYESSM